MRMVLAIGAIPPTDVVFRDVRVGRILPEVSVDGERLRLEADDSRRSVDVRNAGRVTFVNLEVNRDGMA